MKKKLHDNEHKIYKGSWIIVVLVISILFIACGSKLNLGNQNISQVEDFAPTDPLQSSAVWQSIHEVGQLNITGGVRRVQVVGSLAYVCSEYGGRMEIIDISSPTSPIKIGEYATSIYDVQVVGSLAYACSNGLRILNISDPTNPTFLGWWGAMGVTWDVDVAGPLAYCAWTSYGLRIIDISNPKTPTLVGELYDGGRSDSVQVVGPLAYVTDYRDGLEIIDISDPTNPVEIGQFNDGGNITDVQVVGSLAYVTDYYDGLEILDISDPTNPVEVGQFDDGGWAYSLQIEGSLAFVADGYDGLEIIDITDPNAPTKVGQFDERGGLNSVHVVGQHAYLADWNNELVIVEGYSLSRPPWQNIGELGQFDISGNVRGVDVVGDLAYVANYMEGLQIVNITDLKTPYNISRFDDGGTTFNVQVLGSLAYVADGIDGLEIIDISDPTNPQQVGQFDDGGEAYDVQVLGALAYVADGGDELEIINISDPTNPVQVGELTDGLGAALDLEVAGCFAYVADGSDGLEIIDVSDPTSPVEVFHYDDGGSSNGLQVVGPLLYVADEGGGLEIFNISNPTTAIKIGYFNDGGAAFNVQVMGTLAFVADYSDGVEVLDVSDPTNPFQVGQFDDGAFALRLQVVGNIIYVADNADGLEILEGYAPNSNSPSDATYPQGSSGKVINWTLSDNVAGGYYQVLLNGGPHVTWQQWIDGVNQTIPVNTDTTGAWNYTIQFNDSAGIWGLLDTVIITIEDQTAPWDSNPSNATYAHNTTAVITWTLYDNVAGGKYQVLRQGNPYSIWSPWTNNIPFNITLNTLELGVWNYTIQYNDSVGLWGSPDTVLITIEDLTAPLCSNPSNTTHAQGSTAVITWTLDDNVAGGTYQILRNDNPYSSWTAWTANMPFNVTVNTGVLGLWNYTIQYNDSAGLWGTPDTVFITIEDQTAPWASEPADATYTLNSTEIITWTLYDNVAGGTFQILRNGTPQGSWIAWTNNIPFSVTIDTSELGVWNYTIQYNDSLGLWGTPNTVIITITAKKGGVPGFSVLFGVLGLIAIAAYYSRRKPM